MPACRCTLYCFLFERRGLGPLVPRSPAFVSQDTPLHQRHPLFHSYFLSLSSSVASLMKEKGMFCRCGRLPRWAGGMAAVLIDRLPGAPLWGVRGVGGQKALPHVATPQQKHRPHGNAYRGPSLFHALSSVGFYLPSSSLSLALLMEFQRLFSFLCLFELLMQKCSADSLKLWRRRGDRDGGMTQRRRNRKT